MEEYTCHGSRIDQKSETSALLQLPNRARCVIQTRVAGCVPMQANRARDSTHNYVSSNGANPVLCTTTTWPTSCGSSSISPSALSKPRLLLNWFRHPFSFVEPHYRRRCVLQLHTLFATRSHAGQITFTAPVLYRTVAKESFRKAALSQQATAP